MFNKRNGELEGELDIVNYRLLFFGLDVDIVNMMLLILVFLVFIVICFLYENSMDCIFSWEYVYVYEYVYLLLLYISIWFIIIM